MKVIEQFEMGKKKIPELNEDRLVITDNFIAVLDGATPKRCPDIKGKSAARFAVEVGEKIIKEFPREITSREAINKLSEGLAKAVSEAAHVPEGVDKPSFVVAIYSDFKKQIWRVHDVNVLVDGEDIKPIDNSSYITSQARALYLEIELLKGTTEEDIIKHDVGREFIMPLLEWHHLLANNPNTFSGYGVINGDKVPSKFIEIFDVEDANEIIMASDGYPYPMLNLKDSEDYLAEVLEKDKLLYKAFASTKCQMKGQVSFDDRTYIRFNP